MRMAVEMQEIVKAKSFQTGAEINIRIGVHTGKCTGGIIGTVRYHFDMWGGAVYGAVKMEETGEKGRVHVSDKTYPHIWAKFECESQLSKEGAGERAMPQVFVALS